MQGAKLFKSRPLKSQKLPQKKYVYVSRLDFPEMQPKRILLPNSIKILLEEATKVLEMKRPAVTIYDEAGYPFENIESIVRNANLYVSANPSERERHDEVLGKPKPIIRDDTLRPKISHPIMKPSPPQNQPANRDLHFTIAERQETVKDNIRNSILALYSGLSQEHKDQLPCSDQLLRILNETQTYFLQDSLLSQFIGPTISIAETGLGADISEWMMVNLEGIKSKDCRFVFTGPYKSGKSTVLHIAVLLFLLKLQISREASKYIIVPMNWRKNKMIIHDLHKLYCCFVDAVVDALKAANMKLYPVIEDLRDWLISLVVARGFISLPDRIKLFDDVHTDALAAYGERIHTSWRSKPGLRDFATCLVQMPVIIAQAFGFESAVCVYDHFDCCGYVLEDTSRFPESEVSLDEILCDALSACPFFVAAASDTTFEKIFNVEKCTRLTTEGIITHTLDKSIVSSDPSISIRMEMCRGYPAYCALYSRIYDMAERGAKNLAIRGKTDSKFKSVTDCSRRAIISEEFRRLCVLLHGATSELDYDPSLLEKDFDVYII